MSIKSHKLMKPQKEIPHLGSKFNRANFQYYQNKVQFITQETLRELKLAQIPLNASSLAYTTILSLVPLLAMSLAVFQSFGGLDKLYTQIQPFLINHLAEGAGKEVGEYLEKFIGNIHGGALGISGFIALIFTSMSMLSSIENTFNRVWNTQNKRTLFQRVTHYWFFITLGPLLFSIILGFAGSSALDNLRFYIPKGGVNFIFMFSFFFLLYKGVPNCKVYWIPALSASLFATLTWFFGNKLFIFYTQKAFTYSKIYGSLGVIPLFFLWIYIIWFIVLSGTALSYVIQKKLHKEVK